MNAIETFTFTHHGREFRAEFFQDDLGAPWEEHDGHGPVSEWTRRPKAPGEWILCEDRGARRYYDAQEAMQLAKRDGWDAEPFNADETPGQKAAKAVRADFQRLRDWCNDEWTWVYLTVTELNTRGETRTQTVGGYESDSGADFFRAEAENLAEEIIAEYPSRTYPVRLSVPRRLHAVAA